MRLNSLSLVNFRQHAETKLEFDTGLTGLIGPNGSGKSTILEAIAWAIYGNVAARGTRESIRFHRAGARAPVRVELDFELGGNRYHVVRGLTSAELYLDGAAAPIAASITGVSEVLQKRLGMTRGEFFNTYFTGQKDLSVMAAMGPVERGQFLSRVLGYERLRGAQDILRKRRSVIVGEIAGLRQGMPDTDQIRAQLAEAEARVVAARQRAKDALARRRRDDAALAEIRPRWEAAQGARDRAQRLQTDLRVAEGEHAALAKERQRAEREAADTRNARTELERAERELFPLRSLETEAKRLEQLAREDGRRGALLDQRRALDDELGKLGERRGRIETGLAGEAEAVQVLDALRGELAEADDRLEARRSEWARDRQEAETKREALRVQYAEYNEQRRGLEKAGKSGICPTCGQPVGENLQSVLDLLASQMETVKVDGRYYSDRLEQLKRSPDDLVALEERRRAHYDAVLKHERRVAKVEQARQELVQLSADIDAKNSRHTALRRDLDAIPAGYDLRRHDEVRRELERLRPLDQKAAVLRLRIAREPELAAELERATSGLAAATARTDGLRAQLAASPFSETTFTALRDAHGRAADEARLAQVAAAAAESDETNAGNTLALAESAARDLAERQRLLEELGARKRLHDELDRAYTDLRADLNRDLRPELSEIASALLNDLTDGRYSQLELDDQYNVIIHEDELPKPVISGGEEDLTNLVLRLAISQMIAERAGQPLSLLVLDEIFGSLDESRRTNVLELLRRLHDRFEQVILITHIDSVRDGMDRVISVRYDPATGSSVAEPASGALASAGVAGEREARYEEAGAAD
ncbi:MAG: SMC family ATPase [Gemmatimonadaceae bacterium]